MRTDSIKQTRSFDFPAYKTYVSELAKNHLCSGKLSEEHIQATKMNDHRVKRIDKTIEIIPELESIIQPIKDNWEWIVLIESWCGDGAQNLPIIAKMASLSDRIKLTIILRDENPEIMDAHLTNGARAIPKLICINKDNGKEIGAWGPRPGSIQKQVIKIKAENPLISHDEFGRNLHLLYAKDKGLSLQNEFVNLINEWTKSE